MKNILTIVCVCMTFFAEAQVVTVTDQNTREAISEAVIYTRNGNTNVITDSKGKADITPLGNPDTLLVRHTSYGISVVPMSMVRADKNQVKIGVRLIQLNEVVFVASKSADLRSNVASQVESISARQIEALNPQTSADMLTQSGVVFAQKSQMGGGSPVLRGFEANKVLLVVDGVRMNNAIYRGGHLQDIITIDPNMLERTEVLFGPASVIYGSDALGGTMAFYTRRPQLATSGDKLDVTGNFMTRYSNANNEKTGHFDINLGWRKLASLTSFTFSDFGDLRAGNLRNPYDTAFGKRYYYAERINGVDSMMRNSDPNVQAGTAYKQYDINQKFYFAQSSSFQHLLNFQLSRSSDIPRYDRLSEFSGNGNLKFAEWKYGPQKRLMTSYQLKHFSRNGFIYNRGVFIAAFQDIDQQRISRRFRNNFRTDQLENVKVLSLNADFDKRLNGKHVLRYGAELTYNRVNSTATLTNIAEDTTGKAGTRYPDAGSSMNSAAVYITHTFNINDKLTLNEGIRLSLVNLHAKWDDTTFFPFPYKEVNQQNMAPSGSIGLTWRPANQWRLHVLGSSGFRAANIDDIGKVFDSSPGTLIVPNPDLKPEYAWSGEIGMSKTISSVARIDVIYFNTLLTNAMVIKPFQLNGQDSVIYSGTPSQVMALQNADKAVVQGVSAIFTADFNANFSFRSTFNFTQGRYTDTDNDTIIPLDHIPPIYGRTGLVYKNKGLEMETWCAYNGAKRLKDYSPSGEDNLQYATVVGMPAWYTLNVRAGYQFGKYVHLNVALENIMDQHYRYFASGVSAPGRNLVTSLRVKF